MASAEEVARGLLDELRVHSGSDGPVYGVVKAIAAVGYGLLAVADRLERLERLSGVGRVRRG